MREEEGQLSTALLNLGRQNQFNMLNFGLADSITRNEARIEKSAQRINEQFSLHMKKPKLAAAVEFEFLSEKSLDELLDMEAWGDSYQGIPREPMQDFLARLHLELTCESTYKLVNGKPYKKYEIRPVEPSSISEQLLNYSQIITMLPFDRYHLRPYSHHINFSIYDADNPDIYPYNNKPFRDLIGHNTTKFLDEALVLMDTKSSISGYHDASDREPTDIMGYLSTNSARERCYYQVAYRNDDKPLNDYSDDVSGPSTARHELRRTYPGPSSHRRNVCDPVLSGFALITAATAYSFEKGIEQIREPYRYRGTDYGVHLKKFEHSSLLKEYWGESLVGKLTQQVHDYNLDAEFNSLLIPRN